MQLLADCTPWGHSVVTLTTYHQKCSQKPALISVCLHPWVLTCLYAPSRCTLSCWCHAAGPLCWPACPATTAGGVEQGQWGPTGWCGTGCRRILQEGQGWGRQVSSPAGVDRPGCIVSQEGRGPQLSGMRQACMYVAGMDRSAAQQD